MGRNVSKKVLGALLLAGGLAGSVAAHALTVNSGGQSYTLDGSGTSFARYGVSVGSSNTISSTGVDYGGYGVGTGGSSDGGFGVGSYAAGGSGDFIGYYDFSVSSASAVDALFTLQPSYSYPSGTTIEYLLFADGDNDAAGFNLTTGSLVTSFSQSDALAGVTQQLLAGTDYLLAIIFNTHGNAGLFSFDTTVTSTAVATTPLPGAIWLFGTALLGFVGFSNRRKV